MTAVKDRVPGALRYDYSGLTIVPLTEIKEAVRRLCTLAQTNAATAMIVRQDERRSEQGGPAAAAKTAAGTPSRSVSIDYLRTFIVFLVVAFHSTLAYLPHAPAPGHDFVGGEALWRGSPVVDSQRSVGADVFFFINDTFFMTLMFFVSGLFVWQSLRRKSGMPFLRDRFLRLGIPFLFGVGVIMPIAHYASYLQWSGAPGFENYWRAWRALSIWPGGPMWFVLMLLAFDIVAAGLFAVAPHWGERVGALASRAGERPVRFFAVLLILSAFAYLPLAVAYGPWSWTAWGLVQFQISRPVHYFVYFVLAVGVGAYGLRQGLLSASGKLARRWWVWALAAVGSVVLSLWLGDAIVTAIMTSKGPVPPILIYAYDADFVLSCAVLCFALLAVFTRFVQRSNPIFDSLAANSYGIFIVHYAFVAWLQFALLDASLSGAEKWGLVAAAAYAMSWLATAAARRIPAIARIV